MPSTFIFPKDRDRFLIYQKKNDGATYIAKPLNGAQGNNITIFDTLDKVPATIAQSMVVQRYIDSPLLLNGLKFDLRIYVIITGVSDGQIHAFMAEEGLVRFCTEGYQKPSSSNYNKTFMHLTNYSLNK